MSAAPILAAHGLTKVFPPPRWTSRPIPAVSEATFTVGANEILGIIGPNGAGKSTLIDLLATVLAPTSGSLRIGGCDPRTDPAAARRRIGYVPSGGRSLYPRLTALQNLRFFAALHDGCVSREKSHLDDLLHLCGAADVAGTRADRLSDGFLARVALARALVADPAVLLLDEPARSIDPVSRPGILQVIREYANRTGKAALMVTHDVADVFDICDRVAVMHGGRLTRIEDVATGEDRVRLAKHLEGRPL